MAHSSTRRTPHCTLPPCGGETMHVTCKTHAAYTVPPPHGSYIQVHMFPTYNPSHSFTQHIREAYSTHRTAYSTPDAATAQRRHPARPMQDACDTRPHPHTAYCTPVNMLLALARKPNWILYLGGKKALVTIEKYFFDNNLEKVF